MLKVSVMERRGSLKTKYHGKGGRLNKNSDLPPLYHFKWDHPNKNSNKNDNYPDPKSLVSKVHSCLLMNNLKDSIFCK